MNQRIFILFEYCAIAAIFLLLCPPAQAYVHLVYGSLFVQCFLSLFLSAIVITGRSVMAIIGRKAKLANNSRNSQTSTDAFNIVGVPINN